MAVMQKVKLKEQYVQVPNKTAKAVEAKNNENPISLEALGLLVNLWSYDIEKWELHKTELYERFAKNKRSSTEKAWDQLVKMKYIIEFKFKNGRSWEYVYYYRIEPFSDEEIEEIMLESVVLYGVSSTVDFQQLKFNSRKTTAENQHISNTNKRNTNKKNKKENNDKLKKIIDDDEEKARQNPEIIFPSDLEETDETEDQPFKINNFAFKEFVKEFDNRSPNYFNNETYNRIFQQMIKQRVNMITFTEALEQARFMEQMRDSGIIIGDYAAYFVNGIILKRKSLESSLADDKFRRAKLQSHEQQAEKVDEKDDLPFYNWLDAE